MIVYSLESADIIEEMMPLLEEHNKEVGLYPDKIELDPMKDLYKQLSETNMLVVFTMRDDGKLIGYSVFRVANHMHYQNTLCADNDVIYIQPKYRHKGYALEFIKFCENLLKKRFDVSVMSYSMPTFTRPDSLMEQAGMDWKLNVYTKYIGK